jgi:CelD/BcsL family acetyltransferase involved in cellulose biosynthesis
VTETVVAVARTASELQELIPDWDSLYGESEPHNPFLSPDWTTACWDTASTETELFVIAFRSEGRLVGLAPLCIERRGGFRVLRFISEERSDYLRFLRARDYPGVEGQLLQAALGHSEEWDLAILKQIVPERSTLHRIELPPTFEAHSVEAGKAPYMAADVDWDELHEIGPSWLKRTRKRLPRFLRDGWQFERFTGAEAAARLGDVAQIESRSWKARENVTRLQPGAGQELFRRAFETLGARGEMQLWLASIDGQPAAYEIDFVLPKRLCIYQLGYDQEYQRASVGSFLSYVAIEHAWKSGAREYDYMSGDEPYKAERTAASRSILHIAIHSRTLRGRTAYLLLLAPRWRLKDVAVLRSAYRLSTSLKRRVRSAR